LKQNDNNNDNNNNDNDNNDNNDKSFSPQDLGSRIISVSTTF